MKIEYNKTRETKDKIVSFLEKNGFIVEQGYIGMNILKDTKIGFWKEIFNDSSIKIARINEITNQYIRIIIDKNKFQKELMDVLINFEKENPKIEIEVRINE